MRNKWHEYLDRAHDYGIRPTTAMKFMHYSVAFDRWRTAIHEGRIIMLSPPRWLSNNAIAQTPFTLHAASIEALLPHGYGWIAPPTGAALQITCPGLPPLECEFKVTE